MKSILKAIAFLLLLTLPAGCGTQAPAKKPQQEGKGQKQVVFNADLASRVKEIAETVDGVEESTAVVINKEISAAVKVTGFDRLRLKSIREEVHRKISEAGDEYKVYVTSDKKLFSELRKIESQITGGEVKSPAELESRVKKINNSMRG
ncbi:MAG: YhcN/YlaJ family sporulation lipoprotein [Bacillota bacterium]